MRSLFALFLAGGLCATAHAAPKGPLTLENTAKEYLDGAIGKEWEDAKWVSTCGKSKKKGAFTYRCSFEGTGKSTSTAYAVYLNDSMNLVGIALGEGRREGKKMTYSYNGIKDNFGYELITDKPMTGTGASE